MALPDAGRGINALPAVNRGIAELGHEPGIASDIPCQRGNDRDLRLDHYALKIQHDILGNGLLRSRKKIGIPAGEHDGFVVRHLMNLGENPAYIRNPFANALTGNTEPDDKHMVGWRIRPS